MCTGWCVTNLTPYALQHYTGMQKASVGNRLLPAFISGRGGHEGKSLDDCISTIAPDTISTAHGPDVKPGVVSTSTSLSACTPVTPLSPSSSLSYSSSSSKPCFVRGRNQSHQLLHQSNDCVTLVCPSAGWDRTNKGAIEYSPSCRSTCHCSGRGFARGGSAGGRD